MGSDPKGTLHCAAVNTLVDAARTRRSPPSFPQAIERPTSPSHDIGVSTLGATNKQNLREPGGRCIKDAQPAATMAAYQQSYNNGYSYVQPTQQQQDQAGSSSGGGAGGYYPDNGYYGYSNGNGNGNGAGNALQHGYYQPQPPTQQQSFTMQPNAMHGNTSSSYNPFDLGVLTGPGMMFAPSAMSQQQPQYLQAAYNGYVQPAALNDHAHRPSLQPSASPSGSHPNSNESSLRNIHTVTPDRATTHSPGEDHDRSPQPGMSAGPVRSIRQKEGPVKAACLSCRQKKAKCDGVQPVCTQVSRPAGQMEVGRCGVEAHSSTVQQEELGMCLCQVEAWRSKKEARRWVAIHVASDRTTADQIRSDRTLCSARVPQEAGCLAVGTRPGPQSGHDRWQRRYHQRGQGICESRRSVGANAYVGVISQVKR